MEYGLHGANSERYIKGKCYDFSTNTNVIKKRFSVRKKLALTYPELNANSLKKYIPYPDDSLLITSGINEAIYILMSYFDQISILEPTYVEYKIAAEGYDVDVNPVQSIDEVDEGVLFVCNPNNPTGTYMDLTDKLKDDVLYVIDESYLDFYENPKEIILKENVILLRSLTKLYHLSGVRLGYVIGSPTWIKKIAKRQPTWSVNSYAIHIGRQMLKDQKFIKKTKEYYKKETKRFKDELLALGVEIVPSDVHYFLLKVENDEKFIEFMIGNNILVRHTRNFPGLNGRYVRVCTRTKKENNYFIKKMREYVK